MWEKELDFLKVQNAYISIIYKKDIFSGFYKAINQMTFWKFNTFTSEGTKKTKQNKNFSDTKLDRFIVLKNKILRK